MLLFKPEHKDLILAGTKTQTRRIWKKKRINVGSVHLAKLRMISKEYFARIEVLDVYQESLKEISEEDALAEGYSSRISFLEAFCKINHLKEVPDIVVWVVKFRLVYHI